MPPKNTKKDSDSAQKKRPESSMDVLCSDYEPIKPDPMDFWEHTARYVGEILQTVIDLQNENTRLADCLDRESRNNCSAAFQTNHWRELYEALREENKRLRLALARQDPAPTGGPASSEKA